MGALTATRDELASNERQWEAFAKEGNVVVLAPPGSGKTKLLTARLASDLIHRIKRPRGAACITLTNAAADELERRLDILGVDRRSTLFVGTVHSFALARIIVPFSTVCGIANPTNFRIASDAQVKAAMRRAIGEYYREGDARFVDSTVTRLRKMMDSEEWARAGGNIASVNERYEHFLHDEGLVDFDEIVAQAVHLVEGHAFVRRALIARYPGLYVDEYQDLAPGLDRLVQALCFSGDPSASLFAVGDPNQSIYGWTGSRPELLDDLASRSDVSVVKLDINYRSGKEIIRLSSLALGEERVIRGLREGGIVAAHFVPDGFESQADTAARMVKQYVAAGTSYDDVAVLCHSNADCLVAGTALRDAGIPVFVRDNDDYRLTPATLMIEALAGWATLQRGQSGYRLGDLVRRWRTFVPDDDVSLVRLLLEWGQLRDRPAREFVDALGRIGLESGLAIPARADDAIETTKMRQSLANGRLAGLSLADLAERARALGRVYVTTMTASKGLEFDVVMMLGVEQGKIPHFSSTGPALEEDRRKFYVSLTRARNAVHILYSGWFRWRTDGPVSHDGPSQFVLELGLP